MHSRLNSAQRRHTNLNFNKLNNTLNSPSHIKMDSPSMTSSKGVLSRLGSRKTVLRQHRSADESTETSSVTSSPKPSPRFSMFRKSAPEPQSNGSANVERPRSVDVLASNPNLQFLGDLDGLEVKPQDESEWYYNLNINGAVPEEDDDDDAEDREDIIGGSEQEPPSPCPSLGKQLSAKSSKLLMRSLSRVFRGGSKDSSPEEESPKPQDVDSPRLRQYSSSPTCTPPGSPSITSPNASKTVGLRKKMSIWASSSSLDGSGSDAPQSTSSRNLTKSESNRSFRETTILQDMQRLEKFVSNPPLRQLMVDALLASQEDDLLLRIQFLGAVSDWEYSDKDEDARNVKASKIVKRFLGKNSAFRIQGIPELYEDRLFVRQDFSCLDVLKTLVLEQLVNHESILRNMHECVTALSSASNQSSDAATPQEAQV